MIPEQRNALVVASMVASMTLGAVTLLWLEPPARGWTSSTLLMAESVPVIDEVRVEYLEQLTSERVEQYDCIVLPDGQCDWRPSGGLIRLGVVGDSEQMLSDSQCRTLLAALGSMTHRRRLNLDQVWLDPASDARLHPELPSGAHCLVDLLVRKGVIP